MKLNEAIKLVEELTNKKVILENDNSLYQNIIEWIDTGSFLSNNNLDPNTINKLVSLGYKGNGEIYRLLFLKENDIINVHSTNDLVDFIRNKDSNNYISFCKDLNGIKYLLDHYEDPSLLTVVIKQNSEFMDMSEFVNDNYEEIIEIYPHNADVEGALIEIGNTSEVIAKLKDFRI